MKNDKAGTDIKHGFEKLIISSGVDISTNVNVSIKLSGNVQLWWNQYELCASWRIQPQPNINCAPLLISSLLVHVL